MDIDQYISPEDEKDFKSLFDSLYTFGMVKGWTRIQLAVCVAYMFCATCDTMPDEEAKLFVSGLMENAINIVKDKSKNKNVTVH